MSFPTPADNDSDSSATNNGDNDTATIYDGRMEDMEDYWNVVDTERFLQKMCVSYGVAVDNGFARYTDAEGESPLADHGLFYYRTKGDLSDDLSDRRSDGDLESDQNLPNYKDQFGEPETDHVVVTSENAEDFGINPELFDDDEEIHLPSEYEPETDDDGNLVVWYDNDQNSQQDVLKALNSVKGIGDKKAGKALNALIDAGIIEA